LDVGLTTTERHMGPALILFLSACQLDGQNPSEVIPPPPRAAPAPPPPEGSVRLLPRYPEGRFVLASLEGETRIRVRSGSSSKHTMTWRGSSRVGRDEQGRAAVTTTFGEYAASGYGPRGRYRYDSTSGEAIPDGAPDVAHVWTALRGMSVTTVMSDGGELLEAAGTDALREAALAAIAGPMSGARRLALAEIFSDRGYERAVTWSSGYLAPGHVLPGDTWSDTVVLGLPFLSDVTVPRTFTLKRLERRGDRQVAVIGFEGDLETDDARIRRLSISGLFHFDLGYGEVTYESGNRALEMNVSDNEFDIRTSYELTAEIIDQPG